MQRTEQAYRRGTFTRFKLSFAVFLHDKVFLAGFGIIVAMTLMAILADVLAPFPDQGGLGTPGADVLKPPSGRYILGTTSLGQDLLSRMIYGARSSLLLSAIIVSIITVTGFTLGTIAGYFGGIFDDIIMRVTDVFLAFPNVLLSMLLVATIGPGFNSVVIALGSTWWPWHARLARSQALVFRNESFVLAAQSLGQSNFKVMLKHIVPNSLPPNIMQAAADLGSVILAAAGLSFLGLGLQEPTADWGLLISKGRAYFPTFWWYSAFPGMFLSITILGFALMGDAVREFLDPRLRKAVKIFRWNP